MYLRCQPCFCELMDTFRDELSLFEGKIYQVAEDSGERCLSRPFCAAKRLVKILKAGEGYILGLFFFHFYEEPYSP